MKKDELIHMWKEDSGRLFKDEKTDKKMITQYLNERTLRGNRSLKINLLYYGLIQVANIILIALNLAGYLNNPALLWLLLSMLVITLGTLVYGMEVYRKFREINNYSDSLQVLIRKQLRFYRRPYELWLILATVSVIILMSSLNLYIDNDNGSYLVNNKAMFISVTLGAFLFVYGALKITSLLTLRRLKAYLSDLQSGTLDQSQRMERNEQRFHWLWVALFMVLLVAMVIGFLKAIP